MRAARGPAALAAVALLLLLASAGRADAKITTANIKKDDRALILMAEPFGFGADGRINISLSNFQIRPLVDPTKRAPPKPNLSR